MSSGPSTDPIPARPRPSRPTASNVAAGAVIGLAVRPAAAVARLTWRGALASPAGGPLRRTLDALDEAGRAGMESADHALDRAVERALRSPRIDELIDRALASPAYDHLVDRLLETDALWRLVERIANSPEVMDAIAAGSANLAGDVADQVRRRTITADDVAERVARALLRRPRRSPAPSGEGLRAPEPGAART